MATTGPSARLQLDAPADGTTEQVQQGDNLFRAWRLALEARAAMYQILPIASRPAAAAANVGMTFHASDTGVSYLSTGTKWRVQGGFTGALHWSALTAIPDGFLLCNGQIIGTGTPELRTALLNSGSPWGTASGSPLAPPAASRALMAPGAANAGAGLSARAVGQSVGEEGHMQTEAELFRHAHELRSQSGLGGGIPVGITGSAAGRVHQGEADPIIGGTFTEMVGGLPQTKMNVMQPSLVANLLIQT